MKDKKIKKSKFLNLSGCEIFLFEKNDNVYSVLKNFSEDKIFFKTECIFIESDFYMLDKFLVKLALNNVKFLANSMYLWKVKMNDIYLNLDFNNIQFFDTFLKLKDVFFFNLMKVSIDLVLCLKSFFRKFLLVLKKDKC